MSPAGTQGIIAAPLTLHATQLPALTPYSQQWNLTISTSSPKQIMLDVAYVGTKGTHLLGIGRYQRSLSGSGPCSRPAYHQ